jgi:hypothetical protein
VLPFFFSFFGFFGFLRTKGRTIAAMYHDFSFARASAAGLAIIVLLPPSLRP